MVCCCTHYCGNRWLIRSSCCIQDGQAFLGGLSSYLAIYRILSWPTPPFSFHPMFSSFFLIVLLYLIASTYLYVMFSPNFSTSKALSDSSSFSWTHDFSAPTPVAYALLGTFHFRFLRDNQLCPAGFLSAQKCHVLSCWPAWSLIRVRLGAHLWSS